MMRVVRHKAPFKQLLTHTHTQTSLHPLSHIYSCPVMPSYHPFQTPYPVPHTTLCTHTRSDWVPYNNHHTSSSLLACLPCVDRLRKHHLCFPSLPSSLHLWPWSRRPLEEPSPASKCFFNMELKFPTSTVSGESSEERPRQEENEWGRL